MIIILVPVEGHHFYIFHIKLNKSVYFKCVYLFFKTQLKKVFYLKYIKPLVSRLKCMKPIQAGHKLSESKIDKKREMASFNARKKGPIEIQRKTIQFVFKLPFLSKLLPIMNVVEYLNFHIEKIIHKNDDFQIKSQFFNPTGQVVFLS